MRVKRFGFAAHLMLVLIGGALFSSQQAWTKPHDNCHIRILTLRPSGEKNRILFKTHLGSRKQCERLAELHAPNFEPDKIARKDVGYKWVEIR